MSRGKTTCKVLKEVRRKIADANGIPLPERECTHTGDCAGTCPYCESEVRYLERELSKRRALGKAVAVAGIALSAVTMVGCATSEPVSKTTLKNSKTPEEEIPWDDDTMGEIVIERKRHSKEKTSGRKETERMQRCDTFPMPGIVLQSDSSSIDAGIESRDSIDEPPIMGLALPFINSNLYWQFPSSQGTLKSYLRKQLRKDSELRRWLRKKTNEQLRDESKEDIFTVEFDPSGKVFWMKMNFDTYSDKDQLEFEKLFQIFLDMPPWEPYYKVEHHKYYVRQQIPVKELR